jgi:antitoxin PrlF
MTIMAKITSKNQITVPREVRDRLGIGRGDQLEFVLEDSEVIVRPKQSRKRSFTEWGGAFLKRGERVSLEDVKRECRAIREDGLE